MSPRADLQEIRLYGELGRQYGRIHWFQIDSGKPCEAISALIANFPELEAYWMQCKDRGIGFTVFRGKRNLIAEELSTDVDEGPIRIAPIIMGSKSGGIFNIILGAVLVIVGYVGEAFPEYGGDAWGPILVDAGYGMIIGGVVNLLTPAPHGLNNKEAAANQASYAFTGAVNTQAQGNPVPLLYGEMIVGSAVISAGIQTEDSLSTQGVTGGANGGMGGGGCVAVNSLVHVARSDGSVESIPAGAVKVGDVLVGAGPLSLERTTAVVTYSRAVMQPCVEIETMAGARLVCSRTAPIPTPIGLRLSPTVSGLDIAVRDGLGERWERALVVREIGDRWVQHISIDDGCFWAGETSDVQILHHNKLSPAQSPS